MADANLEERVKALEEMAEGYKRKIMKNKRSNDRLTYALYFLLGLTAVAVLSIKYDQETGYKFAVDPQITTAIAGGIGGLAIVGKSYLDAKKDKDNSDNSYL